MTHPDYFGTFVQHNIMEQMKDWNKAKNAYIKDHLSKPLKAPNIRLNALENIETAIKNDNYKLLAENEIFIKYTREAMLDYYLKLKGKPLNSAEKSVIQGLYKFSI